MTLFKCLIVEDEPLAAEILKDYVEQLPQLELVGICPDALYALEALQKQPIDLIFLDIHLPKLKGLDFIKTLQNPPQIILTTAYHQYALQGYELNVVDYLLKPIEFSRFLQAINKLQKPKSTKIELQAPSVKKERTAHFFNVNKRKVKVYTDEILYVESLKEYVKIFTMENVLVTKFQLGELEALLNNQNFLRTHRSYLVAKDKIETFSITDVEIQGNHIPIGRSYRSEVAKVLAAL